MKNIVIVILFTFCIQQSFGQSSNIAGFCDVLTTTTNQNVGIDWDDCGGMTYEGVVQIQSVDGRLYNIYTTNSNGDLINDLSFGAYYGCYNVTNQFSFPNNSALSPTLYLSIHANGTLNFEGFDQWSDEYYLEDMNMNGTELSFSWTNDYDEGAMVQLTRQDGQNWEDLIVPCTSINETDSLALVALYNATNGPNWKIKWFLEDPLITWYGVDIDPVSCQVSRIDLGPGPNAFTDCLVNCGNNLDGHIPEEITNLNNLTILDLRGNHLTGDIPEGIVNLNKLRILDLSLNNLTGNIPEEIDKLNKLTSLNLVLNELTGTIPEEIGSLTSLRRLNLGGNNLTGMIPNQLGNLFSLQFLNLEHNNLTGEIPTSLAQLSSLLWLYLSYNQLSGTIPSGFPILIRVRFNNNMFSGNFPNSFSFPGQLWEINLSNNNFTGAIPFKYFDDFFTQRLYFENNDFSGCVGNISNLCSKPFDTDIDSVFFDEADFSFINNNGYNLLGNPKLAWEGDFQEACNGEAQKGAPCNDGNPDTFDDTINDNCECVGSTVSTIDIKELKSISITPNPSLSGDIINIHLDLNENINAHLKLLDGMGRIVSTKFLGTIDGINILSLDTQNLESGLYFIQLETSHGIVSRKVVLQ